MAEKEKFHGRVDEIDAGDEIISWETWDYPPQERSIRWYTIAGLVGLGLIVYAIVEKNPLFAIAVLMLGLIILLNTIKPHRRIQVFITNLGIVVGDNFHSYKEIKDFSIVYEPPDVKNLYIDFMSRWHPMISVSLEDIDPNIVRQALLAYAFENLEREEESLTDMLRRVYKL